MNVNNINKNKNISNNKEDNLPQINNNIIQINMDNDSGHNYNKVINALIDKDNSNDSPFDNKNGNNNSMEKKEINDNLYGINNENTQNIGSLNNLFLVKNTIGEERIGQKNNNDRRKVNFNNNNRRRDGEEKRIEPSKEDIKENLDEGVINNVNSNSNTCRKEKERKLLSLSLNYNNDQFNVTREQMNIMDAEVNRMYNKHKNNVKLKMFKIKHPYLEHKINLLNNRNNNYEYLESHISREERQKRISPIIEKQKLILEKIKRDNNSRSHISSSINNDSDKYNITKDKIKRLNNYNKKNIYNNYDYNTIDNNNIFNGNNIFISNLPNSNIFRYQNVFNNNVSISSESRSNNSNDKINMKKGKEVKIKYKPYSLVDYKKKYEYMNKYNKKLGGLGANIGNVDWVYRQKLLERKQKYSEYVKSDNEDDFRKMNKIKLKLKKDNNETNKTISSNSKKSYTNDNANNKSESVNNKKLELPLIQRRFNYNKNSKNIIIKNRIKEIDIYKNLNNNNNINGTEKDLRELIKQYEEYNGDLKL